MIRDAAPYHFCIFFRNLFKRGGSQTHSKNANLLWPFGIKMTYNWDKINSVATMLFAVIVSTELRTFFWTFRCKRH